MKRFLEVAPFDFVSVDRITNIKIEKENSDGDQKETSWAVLIFADYGFEPECSGNALYVHSRHKKPEEAVKALKRLLDQCSDPDGVIWSYQETFKSASEGHKKVRKA